MRYVRLQTKDHKQDFRIEHFTFGFWEAQQNFRVNKFLFLEASRSNWLSMKICCYERIGLSFVCVYQVMDAGGKFGEHERSITVAQGDS